MAQLVTQVGFVGYLVSVLWLLTVARRASFSWFLLCLFASPVAVLFAATHWSETKRPVLVWVGSVVLLFVGFAMTDDGRP